MFLRKKDMDRTRLQTYRRTRWFLFYLHGDINILLRWNMCLPFYTLYRMCLAIRLFEEFLIYYGGGWKWKENYVSNCSMNSHQFQLNSHIKWKFNAHKYWESKLISSFISRQEQYSHFITYVWKCFSEVSSPLIIKKS